MSWSTIALIFSYLAVVSKIGIQHLLHNGSSRQIFSLSCNQFRAFSFPAFHTFVTSTNRMLCNTFEAYHIPNVPRYTPASHTSAPVCYWIWKCRAAALHTAEENIKHESFLAQALVRVIGTDPAGHSMQMNFGRIKLMGGQLQEPPQLELNTSPFPRQEQVLLLVGDPPYRMLRQRVQLVLLPFPSIIIELF